MANWPTEKFERTLGKPYCTTTEQIKIWLAPDVEDVTYDPDAQKQLRNFAPDIRQLGLGLYNERRGRLNIWGGLLVRALETRAETQDLQPQRRCLQYIYTWTKQQSAVSVFWMVIVPILMASWGFLIQYLYAPQIIAFQQEIGLDLLSTLFSFSDPMLPVLATGFVSLPLLLSGLWDHRWDLHLGSGVTFRSTTLLIPFSILMWFVAFNWIVPYLIGGFALVVCGLYWFLDQIGFTGTAHPMDYLPVFVWLRRNEDGKWEFERAYWDRHHYNIECKTAEELEEPRFWFMRANLMKKKTKVEEIEERVRLQMDNPWHSVRPGGSVQNIFLFLSVFGLFILIPIALLQVTSGLYTEFFDGGLLFVFACFLVVTAFRTIMRASSELMSSDELKEIRLPSSHTQLNISSEETKNHLNEERLGILWNLLKTKDTGPRFLIRLRTFIRRGKEFTPDISPRFVVITKLQDPFNYYGLPRYYDSFRDDFDYLYLYISSRCPMTEDDRRRSLESKMEFQRKGVELDPRAQVHLESAQMALGDRYDVQTVTLDLIERLDDKKKKVSKTEIEEFVKKLK